jgi:hypothetical protein
LRAVGRVFTNRATFRNQLEARMPEIKKSVLNLFATPEIKRI